MKSKVLVPLYVASVLVVYAAILISGAVWLAPKCSHSEDDTHWGGMRMTGCEHLADAQ